MPQKRKTSERLLALLRDGHELTRRQQTALVIQLSLPAMLAQMANILMFFIDASMVGHLGATEAASVGLVETTFWLMGGLTGALATGFYVQVAHRIGAKDEANARAVLRESFTTAMIFSILVGGIGVAISNSLPSWLGGEESLHAGATTFFMIFAFFTPFVQLNQLSAGMLRCAGDIKTPSLMEGALCILDVMLNFLLIYPTREVTLGHITLTIPGVGMGVAGAALGSGLAFAIIATWMTVILFRRHGPLRLIQERWLGWKAFLPKRATVRQALGIGSPIGVQHSLMSGAQIFTTTIVASLGSFAIAAHTFAITAESLCYMPGYGIGDAATTLVGQSIGAKRWRMAKQLAGVSVATAMIIMTIMGVVLYLGAEAIMSLMTPQPDIIRLGASALRIEAFAEPMFGAAIVCYGVFVGAGSTAIPAFMNLASMWGVRIILALALVGSMGLNGVWVAMAVELTFRGIIFLLRLRSRRWLPTSQ